MKNLLLALTLTLTALLPLKALSGVIEITYDIDFVSVGDNKNGSWVNGTPDGYDDQALIDNYLDGSFFITVRYNDNRSGLMVWDNGANQRITGYWAEILDTNIDFSQSNGNVSYNFFSQISSNRGQQINAYTVVDNYMSWAMTSESIDEVTVGETSFWGNFFNVVGEYEYSYGSSGATGFTDAYTRYDFIATATSVTQVPEPSTIAILGLSLLGLAARKIKK